MNKAKRNNALLIALLFALAPALSFAQSVVQVQPATGQTDNTQIAVPQGFSGIFTCNQNGSNAMSVGALGASGGVYVPVADASVELNTGTLVYKECVLREVVDAQRQAATAGFTQQGTNYILNGRNGAAYFVQQQGPALTQTIIDAYRGYLQNGLSSLDPNIKNIVSNAVAQGAAVAINNPSSMLACPYPDAATSSTDASAPFSWDTILALSSPCNPLVAYGIASEQAGNIAAQEQNCLLNQWQWGGGFYPVTTGAGGPCEQQVVTPSSIVKSSYTTILNSGFTQLQSANDIGQMVGALFSGLSTQVLSGSAGGIAGLNQPTGSSPSYLQQIVAQESQNLQSTIANTALVNLDAALQTEQAYYNVMSSIAGTLQGTISQLRGSENTCWQQISQALCPSGPAANGTCTDVNGVQIRIATSTKFSQPVINAQVASLASTTINNLQVSQQALALINQLIQNVSGTSADSQAVAIAQLNTLISNNELHTPSDITTAQTQSQSVQNAMTTLTQNTPSLWAGTDPNNVTNNNIPWNGSVGATIVVSDPGAGWCNFKNQTTLQAWENAWKV